jgi:hypothetical protein
MFVVRHLRFLLTRPENTESDGVVMYQTYGHLEQKPTKSVDLQRCRTVACLFCISEGSLYIGFEHGCISLSDLQKAVAVHTLALKSLPNK